MEYAVPLIMEKKAFTISYSKTYWLQYLLDKDRVWYVAGKKPAEDLRQVPAFVLKGYFDGSFCNLYRFPTDASMYLFLWNPLPSREKGIDKLIE